MEVAGCPQAPAGLEVFSKVILVMGHFPVLPQSVANSSFKNQRLPSHTKVPGEDLIKKGAILYT